MNPIAEFVKENRKAAGLTQEREKFFKCISELPTIKQKTSLI